MPLTPHNQQLLEQMPAKYCAVFSEFFQIAEVPHASGNRKPIADHLTHWADTHGFKYTIDETFNIVVTVPATPGLEHVPGICFQGHTDMVGVKATDSTHDFAKDPLQLRVEDGWLKATGTTLGADNGMGLATAMAFATDKNIKHGPIELLMTSDEEIGLIGAAALKTCLKSKYLLNLDSEDFGEICVSCAGGFRITLERKFHRTALEEGRKTFEVSIHGYLGGHSGVEINLYRANAIKQMARVLKQLAPEFKVRIVSISGGVAHNAIPAFAKATISVVKPTTCDQGCPQKQMQQIFAKVHEAFAPKEPKAVLEMTPCDAVQAADGFSAEDSQAILDLLLNMPHGPLRFSQEVPGFVETSFATTVMETRDDLVHILGSGRSCYEQELDYLYQQCVSLATLANWIPSKELARYPGWPAKMDSPIVKITEKVYKQHCDHAKIGAIHAGLEAGMVCKIHEGMEAVSIGPTILSPHSPQERCLVETVGKIFEIMVQLCQEIAK